MNKWEESHAEHLPTWNQECPICNPPMPRHKTMTTKPETETHNWPARKTLCYSEPIIDQYGQRDDRIVSECDYVRADLHERELTDMTARYNAAHSELNDTKAALFETHQEYAKLQVELQKRDKCSFMGPMRDCPTHGESEEIKQLHLELFTIHKMLACTAEATLPENATDTVKGVYQLIEEVRMLERKLDNAALSGGRNEGKETPT